MTPLPAPVPRPPMPPIDDENPMPDFLRRKKRDKPNGDAGTAI